MKKIKVLILFLGIILLTGCSGTYNLKINEDLTVEENIDFTISSNNDAYNKTLKLFEDNNISKDKYDVVASDKNVKITYNETYDSIEDYIINSKLYKNLFDTINYENNGKEINISTSSVFKLDDSDSEFITEENNISLLQINVETPYKVVESNAENISDNIYSWTLNKDTTNKDIDFKINIRNKANSYISIIVLSLIGVIVVGTITVIIIRIIKRQKF